MPNLIKLSVKVARKLWLRSGAARIGRSAAAPRRELARFDANRFRAAVARLHAAGCLSGLAKTVDQVMQGQLPYYAHWVTLDDKTFRTHPQTGTHYGLPHWSKARMAPGEDIKPLWEINRLEALDAMMTAALCPKDFITAHRPSALLDKAVQIAAAWEAQNPAGRGINWFSNAEVAMRLHKFLLLAGLLQDRGPLPETLVRLIAAHAAHVRRDIGWTRHSMGNSHYLVELSALVHADAACGRASPFSDALADQAAAQFRADGGNCEGSLNYHVYSLDALAFTDLACRSWQNHSAVPPSVLTRAFDFLTGVSGPASRLPLIGDWDEGRILRPDRFAPDRTDPITTFYGRAPRVPPSAEGQWRVFTEFGLAVGWVALGGQTTAVYFSAGDVAAGHQHLDMLALSCVAADGRRMTERGTGFYNGDATFRDAARSTAAHSSLSDAAHPPLTSLSTFSWRGKLRCDLTTLDEATVVGTYRDTRTGATLTRHITLQPNSITITDTAQGATDAAAAFIAPVIRRDAGHWRCALTPDDPHALTVSTTAEGQISQIMLSERYGQNIPAQKLTLQIAQAQMTTVIR